MPLLNYTTNVPAEKTVGEIIGILSRHKAKGLYIENNHLGEPCGVGFVITTVGGDRQFKLPVNLDAVLRVLVKQANKGEIPQVPGHPTTCPHDRVAHQPGVGQGTNGVD